MSQDNPDITASKSAHDHNSSRLYIAGGGLSGLMTAWRCLHVNPDLIVEIYERQDHLAGDHTWSFNLSDIDPSLQDWLHPFIAHHWPRYDVKFPNRQRTLEIDYCTGNSETLRHCVQPFIDAGRLRVHLGTDAPMTSVSPMIDARGFMPRGDELPGWQKFVGRVIETARPHGLDHPVIMDATVEQIDGYRFIYLLPFSDRQILVEDTYFSDTPNLSENEIGARLDRYITDKGWSDHRVLRSEKGVLPMMMATDREDDSAQIGLRGGFAVAATGFTLPHAVELADIIALAIAKDGPQAAPAAIARHRHNHIKRERYARLLNRMFFKAAKPHKRYIILQRFYGLNDGLIRRFYRNGLKWYDKARILIGKPPVPVSKAIMNMSEADFLQQERSKIGYDAAKLDDIK